MKAELIKKIERLLLSELHCLNSKDEIDGYLKTKAAQIAELVNDDPHDWKGLAQEECMARKEWRRRALYAEKRAFELISRGADMKALSQMKPGQIRLRVKILRDHLQRLETERREIQSEVDFCEKLLCLFEQERGDES